MKELAVIKNRESNAEDNFKKIQKMRFYIISNCGYLGRSNYLQNFTQDTVK